MGIGVKRDAYGGMAQPFLDHLGVDPLGQHKAGMGVSEVMESHPT